MGCENIEILLNRYFKNQVTDDEIRWLECWIANPVNKKYFKQVQLVYEMSVRIENEKSFDPDKGWKTFHSWIKQQPVQKSRILNRTFVKWSAAASLLILIGMGIFLCQMIRTNDAFEAKMKNEFPEVAQSSNVILELTNGTVYELKDMSEQGKIVCQDGAFVLESKSGSKYRISNPNMVSYNRLIVPKGKRFCLELSDGTKVYLNSETEFRYPVIFPSNKRAVKLVGEAFFEVKRDIKRPFVVGTNGLQVKVLGTRFNVSAYATDSLNTTTLVSGSVALYKNENDSHAISMLTPGNEGTFNRRDRVLQISPADIPSVVAWKDGMLLFNAEPFSKIKTSLERWYGVKIENRISSLDLEKFSGQFDHESLDEILSVFRETYSFKWKKRGQVYILYK